MILLGHALLFIFQLIQLYYQIMSEFLQQDLILWYHKWEFWINNYIIFWEQVIFYLSLLIIKLTHLIFVFGNSGNHTIQESSIIISLGIYFTAVYLFIL